MIANTILQISTILHFANKQTPSKKNFDEWVLHEFMVEKKSTFFPYVIILNPQAFEFNRGIDAFIGLGQLMDLLMNEAFDFLSLTFQNTDFLLNDCFFVCWYSETYNKKYFFTKLNEIFNNEDFDNDNYQVFQGNESARVMADFLRTHEEKINFVSNFSEIGPSCEEFLQKSKGEIWRVGKSP